jgi:Zn-dependent protease with chaperone function
VPARRHGALAVVPSFGPRTPMRGVTLLRAAPAIAAVACVAVAASAVAGVAGSILLGVLAALALAHVVVNARTGSPTRILRAVGQQAGSATDDARLLNIVDGLCSAFGLTAPAVVVVRSAEPNAVTVARRGHRATLLVTAGALERLDRIELEALVAHELAHLRRGDVERAAAIMSALSFFALHSGAVARWCARLGGVDRESFADFAATSITRYPPALADALELLDANRGELARTLPRDVVRLTGWQWCAPLGAPGKEAIAAGGLSLQERAQALREL